MTDAARPGRAVPRPHGMRSFALDTTLALLATVAELVELLGDKGEASMPEIDLAIVAGGTVIIRRWAPQGGISSSGSTRRREQQDEPDR